MPRYILQKLMNNFEPLPNRVAAGMECAMLSYTVATDPLNSNLPLLHRCMVAGVAWVAYEYMLDDKLVA
jgi:hypothetical protein